MAAFGGGVKIYAYHNFFIGWNTFVRSSLTTWSLRVMTRCEPAYRSDTHSVAINASGLALDFSVWRPPRGYGGRVVPRLSPLPPRERTDGDLPENTKASEEISVAGAVCV